MAQTHHEAFLVKTGKWTSHPDLVTLRVGGGIVVVLKSDGTAIRYLGEVWEYGPAKQYELQAHGGFVAEEGKWYAKVGRATNVAFDRTVAEKTVPAPVTNGMDKTTTTGCVVHGALSTAKYIICGTTKLERIKLKSIPGAIEGALSRSPQ